MTWSLDPSDFMDVAEQDLAQLRNRVVLDLHRTIVFRSPVDTGRFRGSWNISINRPNDSTQTADTNSAIARGVSQLTSVARRPYETVWINNALPYATKLEDGRSKQAPNGVAAISIESIRVKYEL